MGYVPIFTGRVTEHGALELTAAESNLRRQWLRSLARKDVEVVVRKTPTKRTLDQNAYWHAEPFRKIADEMGEDIEVAKLYILGECFGYRQIDGKPFPIKTSTADLTTEEGAYLTDWMPPWALRFFEGRVQIRMPNEGEIQ